MGSEGELIVVIWRRRLRGNLRSVRCRFIILSRVAEIDIADGQLDSCPLHAVFIVVRADAQIPCSGYKVSLVEILGAILSLLAPRGGTVEIGDVFAVRVLRIRVGRNREVSALGVADLRKDGIGRQTANDGLLVDAHASLSSLNAS